MHYTFFKVHIPGKAVDELRLKELVKIDLSQLSVVLVLGQVGVGETVPHL